MLRHSNKGVQPSYSISVEGRVKALSGLRPVSPDKSSDASLSLIWFPGESRNQQWAPPCEPFDRSPLDYFLIERHISKWIDYLSEICPMILLIFDRILLPFLFFFPSGFALAISVSIDLFLFFCCVLPFFSFFFYLSGCMKGRKNLLYFVSIAELENVFTLVL